MMPPVLGSVAARINRAKSTTNTMRNHRRSFFRRQSSGFMASAPLPHHRSRPFPANSASCRARAFPVGGERVSSVQRFINWPRRVKTVSRRCSSRAIHDLSARRRSSASPGRLSERASARSMHPRRESEHPRRCPKCRRRFSKYPKGLFERPSARSEYQRGHSERPSTGSKCRRGFSEHRPGLSKYRRGHKKNPRGFFLRGTPS
jgi:hypothetical protein